VTLLGLASLIAAGILLSAIKLLGERTARNPRSGLGKLN
jgi:hypothetical protein